MDQQIPCNISPYQSHQMNGPPRPVTSGELGYQHIQQQQIQSFWANQYQEIEQTNEFKNHTLPLARIKKIMESDEDVRMISAEAPVVFAKACEMFILKLTQRSWNHTEENKRTLQKSDIATAITRTDIFDFLVDIVPREDLRNEVIVGLAKEFLTIICHLSRPEIQRRGHVSIIIFSLSREVYCRET